MPPRKSSKRDRDFDAAEPTPAEVAAAQETAFRTSVLTEFTGLKAQLTDLNVQLASITDKVTEVASVAKEVKEAVGVNGGLSVTVGGIKSVLDTIPAKVDNIESMRGLITDAKVSAQAVQGTTATIQGQANAITNGLENVKKNLKALFEFLNEEDK